MQSVMIRNRLASARLGVSYVTGRQHRTPIRPHNVLAHSSVDASTSATPIHDCTPAPCSRRRNLLLLSSFAATWLAAQWLPSPAYAQRVRSQRWDTPTVLTVLNDCVVPIKAYWVNYDGVSELCTVLPPGSSWTVETYATHPWRFVNSATGGLVQEWVAEGGHQVVHVSESTNDIGPDADLDRNPKGPTAVKDKQAVVAELTEPPEVAEAELDGFDGIGNVQDQYVQAKVQHVAMTHMGGVVSLGVEGGGSPLDIYVGVPEAAALFLALGVELRRPQTSLTWSNTLKAVGAHVDRVLITRMVGDTFYARIILTLADGAQRSVDSRPSDGLALALQNSAPIYLAKPVAQLLTDGMGSPLHADAESPPLDVDEGEVAPTIPPIPPIPAGPRDPYQWMKDAKNA